MRNMIFFSPLSFSFWNWTLPILGRMPKFNIVLMGTWIMYKETLQTVYKIWSTKCLTRLNQRLCKSYSRTNWSSTLKAVPSHSTTDVNNWQVKISLLENWYDCSKSEDDIKDCEFRHTKRIIHTKILQSYIHFFPLKNKCMLCWETQKQEDIKWWVKLLGKASYYLQSLFFLNLLNTKSTLNTAEGTEGLPSH